MSSYNVWALWNSYDLLGLNRSKEGAQALLEECSERDNIAEEHLTIMPIDVEGARLRDVVWVLMVDGEEGGYYTDEFGALNRQNYILSDPKIEEPDMWIEQIKLGN